MSTEQTYDDELRGVLFKNDDKTGNQPDYKGELQAAGTEYWLSAWTRESKAGRKYMSLALTELNCGCKKQGRRYERLGPHLCRGLRPHDGRAGEGHITDEARGTDP